VSETVDAIVIGAGHNGLVAATLLADRGWDVLVLETEDTPGGAVRSAETVGPGFVVDLFSAFYPLGVASPVMADLDLESHGLRWVHAPAVLAHPTPDGPTVLLSRDIDVTAGSLDRFAAGDGDAWRQLAGQWAAVEHRLLDALMAPFPPIRGGLRLAAHLRLRGGAEFLRRGLLSVRRMADEHFTGDGGGLLLGGNALHTDLTPESAGSGFFGWMLAGIGQVHGWPVPAGGAQALTSALVRRLASAGGAVRCGARVEQIEVTGGRARGVRLADGTRVAARRAVVADVVAPNLYRSLLGHVELPSGLGRELDRYEPGSAVFKVNWALGSPVPWADPEVARAGTVHLAASLDELSYTAAELSARRIPANPFVLAGQMTTSDPLRSPAGTESLWAYTHVPQQVKGDAGGDRITGRWDAGDVAELVERIERRIEAFAPGFRSRILARHVQSPLDLEAADANLIRGDKSLGTAQLHQQLVFRPTIGWGRPETFVESLYLGSGSAHPGGGVHGACGANAARAALWGHRRARARGTVTSLAGRRADRRAITGAG
jgi:phytoene dehydrogenase-like protein